MTHIRSFLLASAAVAATIGLSSPATACTDEPYIGSICTFAFDWCPRGYVPADGRSLPLREYQALFSLISFAYGGDGASNFNVPDLRGRTAIAKGQGTGLSRNVIFAEQFGTDATLLQPNQVPLVPHNHPASFTGIDGGSQQVTIPAQAGTLAVSASLPLLAAASTGASTGTTSAPANSATNYIGPLSGKFGSPIATNISFTGPFYNLTTPPTTTASAPVTTSITGDPAIPQIQFTVPTGITGGTVSVGQAGRAATASVDNYQPSLGMTVCIATVGLYPNRP